MPELLAHRRGEAHRRMEAGREAEPHADLVDAARDAGRAEVGDDTQRLEHVGRAARGRRGPAAVLARPWPRSPATTRAAMVDTLMLPSAVTAGAAGVDDLGAVGQVERHRVGDHGPDEPGHLGDRLALGPQGDGERGDLRGGRPRPRAPGPSTTSAAIGGQRSSPSEQPAEDARAIRRASAKRRSA